MPFGSPLLGLLGLPWIEATVSIGERPITATDRKQLAPRLRAAVGAELERRAAGGPRGRQARG